ncbi:MAG: hypoxanthine phosphoribosyltransferase [Actinobacteria bacterium]|nr:hypoxanthine phosphoribosyltransferase [Actinomycetota bacterium]
MALLKAVDPKGLLKKELITEEEIKTKVEELAERITIDYQGKKPLFIGILKGAFVFLSDLVRKIEIPLEIDFMSVSSYGKATQTSGVVKIEKDLDRDIRNRHIILVEDILDTGLTLKYLVDTLSARNPASIEICTLLVKEGKQRVNIEPKYVGFTIPDEFVVGYGLDFAGMYRHLNSIYAIDTDKI